VSTPSLLLPPTSFLPPVWRGELERLGHTPWPVVNCKPLHTMCFGLACCDFGPFICLFIADGRDGVARGGCRGEHRAAELLEASAAELAEAMRLETAADAGWCELNVAYASGVLRDVASRVASGVASRT